MIDRFYRHHLTRIIDAFLVRIRRTLIYQRFVIAFSASEHLFARNKVAFNIFIDCSSIKFPEIIEARLQLIDSLWNNV